MNTLGGGTTHAVMGMRVWSDQVRPIASIGRDFPVCLVEQMGAYFDLSGLVRRKLPNPRAWQLFDEAGARSEVFRTTYADFLAINPLPHELPLDRLQAHGVHLQSQSPEPALQWIERLRHAGSPYILYEPWDQFCLPENFDAFMELARQCDAVSPNLSEARQLTGLNEPEAIAAHLLDSGVPLLALRMGAEGSLIASRSGERLRVPAAPVDRVVDVTGAGNAFCGGWITGMVETGDLGTAARRAAVSAALAIRQYGALYPLEGLAERAAALYELVEVN
jgi:sugar/nucleoside kinase (ribokinase family)